MMVLRGGCCQHLPCLDGCVNVAGFGGSLCLVSCIVFFLIPSMVVLVWLFTCFVYTVEDEYFG
jgi:hypothetical protein